VTGGLRDPAPWHRGHPERRLAGVCAAVAHHLDISVTVVRAGFVLLSLVHGIGLLLYAALWLALPEEPGRESGLDRIVDALRSLLGIEPPRKSGPPPRDDDPGDAGSSGGWSPTRS
jgi:phage shock protein PspC (stress-responsive transcriptional regulator)